MKKKLEVLPGRFLNLEIDDGLVKELTNLGVNPEEDVKSAVLLLMNETLFPEKKECPE